MFQWNFGSYSLPHNNWSKGERDILILLSNCKNFLAAFSACLTLSKIILSFDILAFCSVVSFGVCQALLLRLLTYPKRIQQSSNSLTVQFKFVLLSILCISIFSFLLEVVGAEMRLILIVKNDTDIQWICCKHMLKHRGNKMAKIVMLLLAMTSQNLNVLWVVNLL